MLPGSLVVRSILLPFEESIFIVFAKTATGGEPRSFYEKVSRGGPSLVCFDSNKCFLH